MMMWWFGRIVEVVELADVPVSYRCGNIVVWVGVDIAIV